MARGHRYQIITLKGHKGTFMEDFSNVAAGCEPEQSPQKWDFWHIFKHHLSYTVSNCSPFLKMNAITHQSELWLSVGSHSIRVLKMYSVQNCEADSLSIKPQMSTCAKPSYVNLQLRAPSLFPIPLQEHTRHARPDVYRTPKISQNFPAQPPRQKNHRHV